jgi:hypothetical protein
MNEAHGISKVNFISILPRKNCENKNNPPIVVDPTESYTLKGVL